jgi:hypothetical protein
MPDALLSLFCGKESNRDEGEGERETSHKDELIARDM